jgi:hypothetical protein
MKRGGMTNTLDFHVRFVRSFFGLGFGMERSRLCNDEYTRHWWAIHCKVFLGPVVVYWTVHLHKSNIPIRINAATKAEHADL